MQWNCTDNLHIVTLIWDGTDTGKNLAPLREQVLSYKSIICDELNR